MANMVNGAMNGDDHQPHDAYNASPNGTATMPAYSHVVGGAMMQPQPQLGLAIQPHVGLPNLAYTGPMFQPRAGALSTRSTFFVEVNVDQNLSGQMYVECFEPLLIVEQLPIILIHGDFHTGQIWSTKPDGDPGWASFFCFHGQRVYVVDLPPFGRSNLNCRPPDRVKMSKAMVSLDKGTVERELTAPGRQESEGWTGARNHFQWPGTGQRGDPIFENYCSSLVPLRLKKAERQALAQDALGKLLERTGRAILVGEGSGATMAWLAADLNPDMVAAVVAVEPAGPPAGTASHTAADRTRRYSPQINFAPGVRPYGLAEIPLTYDPPLEMPNAGAALGHGAAALDLVTASWPSSAASCVLQSSSEMTMSAEPGANLHAGDVPVAEPRKLKNLRKMRHAIVTAHASSHSMYDWATAQFLRQAGVRVFNISLEKYDIFGNGHLMFLENNSDEIASLIGVWIGLNARAEPEQMSEGCTAAFAGVDGVVMG